jgi:nucleotide-binding universal stress UspA family protein
MAIYKHLLVPTDFEACSRHALERAMAMATAFSAEVTLLHVWEPPVYPYVVPAAPDYVTAIEEAVKHKLEEELRFARERLPTAHSELKMGVVWKEIISTSEALAVDLIVMGTHGRRGLEHALLGSVSEKVIRTSKVSVLTVPAKS